MCRLGSLLRKLRFPLLKSFIRSCLDYVDIIYDQVYTVLFYQKIESVQYNSILAITGAIRGTSKEKLYQEPGLKTLENRRYYRKLYCFFKIFISQSLKYLFNIIPTSVRSYNTRNATKIIFFSEILFSLLQLLNEISCAFCLVRMWLCVFLTF